MTFNACADPKGVNRRLRRVEEQRLRQAFPAASGCQARLKFRNRKSRSATQSDRLRAYIMRFSIVCRDLEALLLVREGTIVVCSVSCCYQAPASSRYLHCAIPISRHSSLALLSAAMGLTLLPTGSLA